LADLLKLKIAANQANVDVQTTNDILRAWYRFYEKMGGEPAKTNPPVQTDP